MCVDDQLFLEHLPAALLLVLLLPATAVCCLLLLLLLLHCRHPAEQLKRPLL